MIRTETRLQYANGYLDLGMTKEAAQELDAIEDKDRLPGEYLTVRIRLHLGTRKWKRMELASKRLTELEPQNPYGWVNWAYALRERNRIKEAMSVAEAGLEFVPEEAVLWFNFACYCSLMGEVEDASLHLDEAVRLDKAFEAEAVDDADLDNLWQWIRSKENA
jgi:predicted Zn-dependent protease